MTTALQWWRTEKTAEMGTKALSALLVYMDYTDNPHFYRVNFDQTRAIPAQCDTLKYYISIIGAVDEWDRAI